MNVVGSDESRRRNLRFCRFEDVVELAAFGLVEGGSLPIGEGMHNTDHAPKSRVLAIKLRVE